VVVSTCNESIGERVTARHSELSSRHLLSWTYRTQQQTKVHTATYWTTTIVQITTNQKNMIKFLYQWISIRIRSRQLLYLRLKSDFLYFTLCFHVKIYILEPKKWMAYAAIFKLLSCMTKLVFRKSIFTSFEEAAGKSIPSDSVSVC